MSGKSTSIGVLGAGAWGTALACVMARNGHPTRLWGRDEALCAAIATERRNNKYLPDITLAENIDASTDLQHTIKGAQTLLVVVPVQATHAIAQQLKPIIAPETLLIMCSKGIDQTSMTLPSEVMREELPHCDVAVLSGPSFAKDVSRGLPTAVTLAHRKMDTALALANNLSGEKFRIYASDDIKGVELAGALKNVVAITIGIARGLGLGASAEAALIARGYAEVTRLATKLGANPASLLGLAGIGDLVLTCSNTQSRNFSYGMAVGAGKPLEGLPLAEGAKTVFLADRLAQKHNIECPLIAATRAVLNHEVPLSQAMLDILQRPIKAE